MKSLPGICLSLLALFSQALQAETQLASTPGAPLFRDDFDSNLSQWVVEQVAPGTTQIQDGTLDINDVGGCTVWFKEKLSSPILIECEVTMIQAGGANDRVSDLNVFWMATDPANPENFFANSAKRGGLLKLPPASSLLRGLRSKRQYQHQISPLSRRRLTPAFAGA